MSEEAYRAHRKEGELWCSNCRAWHPAAEFPIDNSRSTGHKTVCRASFNASAKASATARRRASGVKERRLVVRNTETNDDQR